MEFLNQLFKTVILNNIKRKDKTKSKKQYILKYRPLPQKT